MAIMNFQLVAVLGEQAGPIEVFGNGRAFVERRPALLIRHLKEEQKRQLLDVVAVRQPVIAQDVAVIPEFLDELMGLFCHNRVITTVAGKRLTLIGTGTRSCEIRFDRSSNEDDDANAPLLQQPECRRQYRRSRHREIVLSGNVEGLAQFLDTIMKK